MPMCPYCSEDISVLYASLRKDLIWQNEQWIVESLDDDTVVACSACYEEFGPKDLEKLYVPKFT